jgi:predicted GNAT superfamily acetyltransferase
VSDGILIRELASPADYAACVELQKETWGREFTQSVPATILQVAQKLGGIAAGAFQDDRLIGFVFGMTGVRAGEVAHWSDMLAVRAGHRNQGIGERLKQYQKRVLLERGVRRVYWTFDPLESRNAHLNFNRLGVYAREYVVDMYGDTGSQLHATGTDRLIVIWELDRARPKAAADLEIEIPLDIHDLVGADSRRAQQWRAQTRAQFQRYLPEYVVTGFVRRDERGYYALTSASNFTA